MTVAQWVRAQESFIKQPVCVEIGVILDRVETTSACAAARHAARKLKIYLGIIVDQLVKGKSDFVAPSLFQRILLSSFLAHGTINGDSMQQLIPIACQGLDRQQTAVFSAKWTELTDTFAMRSGDADFVSNIVEHARPATA